MTKKELRQEVHNKYGGKCSYCGCELQKGWHVDHIEPHWHCMTEVEAEKYGVKKGSNEIENLNPSCPRCNRWKSTFTVDMFREQISKQTERLRRDSSNYRMALDYGTIKEISKGVKFYFETYKK